MRFHIILIALILMPFCYAEEISALPPDRFQIIMMQQESRINGHIDQKYEEWEKYSTDAINSVRDEVNGQIDSIIRRLVIGILASYFLGAVIVLLFVNWYLRKFYRTEWK